VQKGVDKVKKSVWIYMALVVGLVFAASSAKADNFGFGTGPAGPADALAVGCFGSVGCPTTLVANTGVMPFSSPSISGNIEEIVLSDTGNVFCSGCLDFEIQVDVNNGPDSIGRVTTGSFTGFEVDAGYDSIFSTIFGNNTGTAIAPNTVDRNTLDTIGFNFNGGGITVGNSSDILEIETNATSYTTGAIGLIDTIPTYVYGYAPAVPEPATLSVLGIGLLGLLGLRKKNA